MRDASSETNQVQLAQLPAIKPLNEWIEATEALPLPIRRRILWRMPRRVRPFLFRYQSLQHPYQESNLAAALVGSMLRLNPPADFNDPFEMATRLVLAATDQQRSARFSALVRTHGYGASEPELKSAFERLMSESDVEVLPRWDRAVEHSRKTTGVCCFAGSGNNTLMWSHYANNHKGVCLQFDRVLDLTTFSHAVHVDYESKLPELNLFVDFQENIGTVLLRKHQCWSYERESRIMLAGQAGRYIAFRPEALRGIIFGCRADFAVLETVERLLRMRREAGLPPIRCYVARKHSERYRIIVMLKRHSQR